MQHQTTSTREITSRQFTGRTGIKVVRAKRVTNYVALAKVCFCYVCCSGESDVHIYNVIGEGGKKYEAVDGFKSTKCPAYKPSKFELVTCPAYRPSRSAPVANRADKEDGYVLDEELSS